jgi:hypothetical protein
VAVSTIGCSVMPFGKSAKNPEPAKEAGVSKIEWGARNWEYYAEENNGVTYYLDKSTISYPSKNIIHVWRRRVFPEAAPGTRAVRSSHKELIGYDEMNCVTEKYRTLESQGVNWDGTTTAIFTRPTPWMTIYNDTADDRVRENYCKEAAKAGKP